MIVYKLFRLKEGKLYPLFINRKKETVMNKWLESECFPTKGIDKEIKTILEGFTGFFRVIFTSYSVEEEIEHVLSGIKRFKNQI